MTSMFGKRDGYVLLNQADDVHLLDSEESIEDQVTFQFRLTGKEMDPEPGPSTSQDLDQPDTSVMYNIPGENGRLEFLDLKEPVLRQCSVTEYQENQEAEENLKCFISSLLFVLIVIAVILVAFLINPSV